MRPEPPNSGPELQALTGFLDLQRETILRKTDGLTREQPAQTLPPSTLTLAGLVNHLALVEDTWFRVRFAGLEDDELWRGHDWAADPDHEFPHGRRAGARGAAPAVPRSPGRGPSGASAAPRPR